jgi:hypothetical protein
MVTQSVLPLSGSRSTPICVRYCHGLSFSETGTPKAAFDVWQNRRFSVGFAVTRTPWRGVKTRWPAAARKNVRHKTRLNMLRTIFTLTINV